ncbi:OmpA family protein [Cecembia calidifontis]|uniref:OmpA family protein n=2 Tax=Cecembia calidifontis TaxID=1187080 RepID=A0A4Q7P5E8_9BACT|nr:OmpA family protein [Cecembia calidifontis]
MVLIMKKRIKILFAAALLLLSTDIYGQARLLRYGDKQYGLENYARAAEAYREAYGRRAEYGTAVKLAESYDKLGMYAESYEWWGRAVGHEGSGKEDYGRYLRSAIQAGRWEDVDGLLQSGGYTEYDFAGLDLAGMRRLMESPARVKLVPVAGANSGGSDIGASLDGSGAMYFSSDRGTVGDASRRPGIRLDAKNNIYSTERSSYNEREFYRIYRKDGDGGAAVVVTDLAGALHVSDPSLMADRGLVFYTAFVGKTRQKGTREITNHAGIYYGRIDADGNITGSVAFPYNDHQSYGVMNPFVDSEAKRIYFASDMPGGLGGFDLYYVEYDGDMNFSAPVNLGPEVNTAQNESHPSRSGGSFYFSSRGHGGLGGMDVFRADYNGGKIGNVRNMGVPYNSVRDDFAFVAAGDGKRYLSTDREGGMGLDDIYTVEDLFRILQARVRDCEGDVVSDYSSELSRQGGGSIAAQLSREGILTAELDPEGDFVLRISRKGYFPVTDGSLSTKGLEADTLKREYVLAPIPYRTPVYVDIVYYDLDRSEIRKDAEPALDRIGELMGRYGFMDLVVSSHTDSRASEEYNRKLSERRANSVRDYLSRYGIDGGRVRLEWHGEQKLVNDCGDGVACPETEHQLNRRSELVLEAFPDTDRQYDLPEGVDPCDLPGYLERIGEEAGLPTVYFDFDRSGIRPVHRKELERVGVMMNRKTDLRLYIEGHTDNRGSDAYNMGLSERRAQAVMDYLVKRGVESSRMEHRWFGESRPKVDCASGDCTEAQHQQNRRTELRLSSK